MIRYQKKGNPMNKFRIVLEVETYSADPEDWVVDSIAENLEDDESLRSCQVSRVEEFSC
tara:strand:+ start:404 stop:580 length:177 start_codon:yes stop_codon:yes gene_type:complete